MSYEKMMRRSSGHRHDKDYQPIIMSLSGTNIESLASMSRRTANTYNVRVRNNINEEFVQISREFSTEDEAVQYCIDEDLDNKYVWVRIYNDKGLRVSGW